MPARPESTVDRSLFEAMGRARRPSMLGLFFGAAIVGALDGWTLGIGPLAITGLGAVHAVYERRVPEADRVLGLTMDTLIIMYITWVLGVPTVVVGYGMMLAVFASYFAHGRKRTGLWVLIPVCVALVLAFDYPVEWIAPTSQNILAIVLPVHAVTVAVFVLSIASAELRRSAVERGYVVGTVAHELRNDLTPVVGLSSVLVDELRSVHRPDLAEMAGIVAAQALDASDTVDDLLTMARIDREALGLDLRPINVGAAVAEVVERYGLDSVKDRQPRPNVEAMGDPVRVKQIVRNLCTNAQRYGGEVVEVLVELDGLNGCHVIVRDNGDGIAADEVVKVFEPFGRGSAGRLNTASVGLGLWLSRQLASAMDGALTYRRENGWTIFDLRLPTGPPLGVTQVA